MEFDDYQQEARKTAIYPQDMKVAYPTIGLAGETGEVAEKVKKCIRDNGGVFDDERRTAVAEELGDVLWYLAAIASDLGCSLDDIARMNIKKLRSRASRAQIHGEGDHR